MDPLLSSLCVIDSLRIVESRFARRHDEAIQG